MLVSVFNNGEPLWNSGKEMLDLDLGQGCCVQCLVQCTMAGIKVRTFKLAVKYAI
jgi:hypothetical protein